MASKSAPALPITSPRWTLWLGITALLLAVLLTIDIIGGFGLFDFEIWSSERAKPSFHYLGSPR